jgi:hypothetical protein
MRLKSFLDVISTDAAYENLNVGLLEKDQDMYSGKDLRYNYLYRDVKISADVTKIAEINDLRDAIYRSLENDPQDIVLIDEERGNIYTSIKKKNDSFFHRLAENIEDFCVQKSPFKNEDDLKKKINEILPYPAVEDISGRQCTLF